MAFVALLASPVLADDVIVTSPPPRAPAQQLREATPIAPVAPPQPLSAARHEPALSSDPDAYQTGITPDDRNPSAKANMAR
jgi:hypothetical protein